MKNTIFVQARSKGKLEIFRKHMIKCGKHKNRVIPPKINTSQPLPNNDYGGLCRAIAFFITKHIQEHLIDNNKAL